MLIASGALLLLGVVAIQLPSIVPGAGHNESLHENIWEDIDRWLDSDLSPQPDGHPTANE